MMAGEDYIYGGHDENVDCKRELFHTENCIRYVFHKECGHSRQARTFTYAALTVDCCLPNHKILKIVTTYIQLFK